MHLDSIKKPWHTLELNCTLQRLEREMATHSSILAWRIPWTEDPGGLLFMGSQRVRHDWVIKHFKDTLLLCSKVKIGHVSWTRVDQDKSLKVLFNLFHHLQVPVYLGTLAIVVYDLRHSCVFYQKHIFNYQW